MRESKPSPTRSHSHVVFAGEADHAAGFFLLLQQGVMILRRVGVKDGALFCAAPAAPR